MTNPAGNFYCGVDIGASATKLVLLDADLQVLAMAMRHSGVDYRGTARQCLDEALGAAGLSGEPVATISTGYGRKNADFAGESRTEIHCHGTGCYHQARQAVSVIDIGGQDNKVIHLDDFLLRRSLIAMEGKITNEVIRELSKIFQAELSWDETGRLDEINRLFDLLQKKHNFTVDK